MTSRGFECQTGVKCIVVAETENGIERGTVEVIPSGDLFDVSHLCAQLMFPANIMAVLPVLKLGSAMGAI